jgi:small subunit ribosomal protein S20
MRQTKVRTAVNRAQRSALRSAVKKAKAATGTAAEKKAALLEAERLLDRAGRKNLIHKNTAARTRADCKGAGVAA